MGLIGLTMICSLVLFTNKRHVAPRLSLVNVAGLNKVLRFEIFVSKDKILRAIHLILDFRPFSNQFQDVGQAIRAGDPRLRQIDVSVPDFLAREDLPPVELPLHRALLEVATSREKIASSCLSLEAEINQFHIEEEEKMQEELVEISDSECELDRASAARSPKLIVTHVDPSFEEDEEMDLNPRRGLKDLLTGRNKGAMSKEVPKSQVPANLPPSPPLFRTIVGLLPNLDLKKKRKVQEMEKSEVVPQKGPK